MGQFDLELDKIHTTEIRVAIKENGEIGQFDPIEDM